jgi:hypothetical protein
MTSSPFPATPRRVLFVERAAAPAEVVAVIRVGGYRFVGSACGDHQERREVQVNGKTDSMQRGTVR